MDAARLDDTSFGDVVLVVGVRRFHVHRAILAMWSPVFSKMFSIGMRESAADVTEVPIHEESVEEFEIFLRKMYPPCSLPITHDNVGFLARIADKFSVSELSRQCEQFLLGEPPTLEALLLAERYNFDHVIERHVSWVANPDVSRLSRNEPEFAHLSKRTLLRIIREDLALRLNRNTQTSLSYIRVNVFTTCRSGPVGSVVIHHLCSLEALAAEAIALVDPTLRHGDVSLRRMARRRNGTTRPSGDPPFNMSTAGRKSVSDLMLEKGIYVRRQAVTIYTPDAAPDSERDDGILLAVYTWQDEQIVGICDLICRPHTHLDVVKATLQPLLSFPPEEMLVFDEETPDLFNFCEDGSSSVADHNLRTGDCVHVERSCPAHFNGAAGGAPRSLAYQYLHSSKKRKRADEDKGEEESADGAGAGAAAAAAAGQPAS